ncbi:MAG: hypothetical protein LBC45_03210 [Chlamydiales bacterium]|jgi:hypothetical protein|nr:hypothetical protein [Chlamydiales bacterium]
MAGSTDLYTTPFHKQMNIKDYLIGQTAFSAAFGFFVCRLPLFQSAALGLSTEGCRYATDRVMEQLSTQFPLIRENRTFVKTAFIAGLCFLAKAAINTFLPGYSTLIRAGLLMGATYLAAEPIARRVYEACTTNEKTVKQCFYLDVVKKKDDGSPMTENDIPVMDKENLISDLTKQYPTVMQKITHLWNQLFNASGNRLGSSSS